MDKISLIMQQTHIASLLSRRLDLSLSVHGINFTEFSVMYHLFAAHESKLSRIALAEKIGLTASGVTRVLAPMEKNHLTTKESNPRDARQSLVVLTQTGMEVLENALVTIEDSTDIIFSLLSEKELDTLLGLLSRLKC
ncbi:MAG: MarR family winged helix-turn-helix transcriptional regulator [Alphaproteobacteria bacterium]